MKLSRRDALLYALVVILGIICSLVWTPIIGRVRIGEDMFEPQHNVEDAEKWRKEHEKWLRQRRVKELEERNKRIPPNGVPL